jgi:hypothetical protein
LLATETEGSDIRVDRAHRPNQRAGVEITGCFAAGNHDAATAGTLET